MLALRTAYKNGKFSLVPMKKRISCTICEKPSSKTRNLSLIPVDMRTTPDNMPQYVCNECNQKYKIF